MSSKARRLAALLAIAISLVPLGGCRNPFLPSTDISIPGIEFPGIGSTPEMTVFAATTVDYYMYRTTVYFTIHNKVDVVISSANITYTDLAGNPVSAYAATGGKNVKLKCRLYAPLTNDPNGNITALTLLALDTRVYEALQDPTLSPKYIICTMTFRGEDDNGYDVKLTAQFTIKGYGF
jgi:hypothetical protein